VIPPVAGGLAISPDSAWALTRSEFFGLAELPPETEWFADIDNAHTKRAYRADIADFMAFTGITVPIEFRIVTRGHVLAWRKSLEDRSLSGATIRRKMAALSSLFEYLSEKNAVANNSAKGAKRPRVDSNEGKTPPLGDYEARVLLAAPTNAPLHEADIAKVQELPHANISTPRLYDQRKSRPEESAMFRVRY
jgi:Phage integrase, N-terminal SAM-like domain